MSQNPIEIQMHDKDHNRTDYLSTRGCVILYIDEKTDRIQVTGKIDMKALTPLISKVLLERMNR